MDKKIMAVAAIAILVVAGCGVYFVSKDDDSYNILDNLTETHNYLQIFGNADGDYDLDNDDIDAIQAIIDEKTEKKDLITVKDSDKGKSYYLADANLDGVVDSKDIDFLKGILDRSGESINFLDTANHLCTVPMTSKRVSCDFYANAEMMQLFGVQDRIVAASNAIIVLKDYYLQGVPDMSKVANFYARTAPDFETLNEAKPDLVLLAIDWVDRYVGNVNAPIVVLDSLTCSFDNVYASPAIQSALLGGYIFNNVEKGQEYAKWYLETFDMLYSKTKDLKDSDRPDVFFTAYGQYLTMKDGASTTTATKTLRAYVKGDTYWQAVKLAGGTNVLDSKISSVATGSQSSVDIEAVADIKYDYLFVHAVKYMGNGKISATTPANGYICDDSTEYKNCQKTLGDISLFSSACDSKNMYISPGDFMNNASGGLLSAIMIATIIHADIFPDLDLFDEFQKYVNLMGFDYNVREHGTFVVYNE